MNRSMLHILIIVSLNEFSIYFMRPFLPYYIQQVGGPDWLVVAFPSVVALMLALSTPAFGRLSDRFGAKAALVLGSIGAAAAYLGMAAVSSVTILLIFRTLAGAMGGNSVITQAAIGRTVDPGLQSVAMGYLGAATNLAIVLAPISGAAFLYAIDAGNSDRLIFVVSALVAAMAGMWALFWFSSSAPQPPSSRTHNSFKNLIGRMDAVNSRNTIAITLIGAAVAFGNFALLAALPLSIQFRFGWEGKELAVLIFLAAGAAVLCQVLLMKVLVQRVPEGRLLTVSVAVSGVATIGFGFSPSGVIAGGCYIVFLATYAIANSVLGGLLGRCAEPSGRASLFGYYSSARNLAQVGSPIVAAVAFQRGGIEYSVVFAAIALVAACFVSLRIRDNQVLKDTKQPAVQGTRPS